jgi:hypothetical protein
MSDLGIIRDIDKGKGEVIRVEVSEYKGKKFLNIRVWYTDANGDLKPTQKGIAIPPELFTELKEAIDQAGGMF